MSECNCNLSIIGMHQNWCDAYPDPQPAPQAEKEVKCACYLSHPSYVGFIGNHSPLCPMNRDINTNCNMPDLLKQLAKPSPAKSERISDDDIDLCVRKYDTLLGGCPLCKIIRQLQSDLKELDFHHNEVIKSHFEVNADLASVKAECLPWIENYPAVSYGERETKKSLILKLSAGGR